MVRRPCGPTTAGNDPRRRAEGVRVHGPEVIRDHPAIDLGRRMTTRHPELVTALGQHPLITVGRVIGQDGMATGSADEFPFDRC